MDIFIITFADGTKEEYRGHFLYQNRVNQLEKLGLKKGKDYKVVQLWL